MGKKGCEHYGYCTRRQVLKDMGDSKQLAEITHDYCLGLGRRKEDCSRYLEETQITLMINDPNKLNPSYK